MRHALAEAIELFEAGLANCHRAEDRVVVERYLAALAPVLAKAVLQKDILGQLRQVERLFGHSWLIDQGPFEPAFAKWREFRAEYERFAVGGMTVHERLHAFALMEDYDRAVEAQDLETVRSILSAVHLDDESIVSILARVRGNA